MKKMKDNPVIVFSTLPKSAEMQQFVCELLEQRLAACVNCIENVQSFFHWQGKIDRAEETLLLIKTTAGELPRLTDWIKTKHPYDIPEILAVHEVSGLPEYLQWLVDSVQEINSDR